MQKNYSEKNSALAFILSIVLPNFLAIFCVLILSFFYDFSEIENSLVYLYLAVIISQVAFFMIYFFITQKNKISFGAIKHKKLGVKQIFILLLISFFCLFFISPIINVYDAFLVSLGLESQKLALDISNPINFAYYIFSAGLIAPVCEELLFRGVILGGLESKGKTRAVIISSIMFMLMHLNVHQTIYQFMLGIILALIVLNTQSIFASIFVHIVNNCVVLLINYISPNLFSYKFLSSSYIVVALVCLIIALISIYYLLKFLKPKNKGNSNISSFGETTNEVNKSTNLCNKVANKSINFCNKEVNKSTNLCEKIDKNKKIDYVYLSLACGILFWVLTFFLTI